MSNVIKFPTKDNSKTTKIRKILNLPECNRTKPCMDAKKDNVFLCPHWQDCCKHRATLNILNK